MLLFGLILSLFISINDFHAFSSFRKFRNFYKISCHSSGDFESDINPPIIDDSVEETNSSLSISTKINSIENFYENSFINIDHSENLDSYLLNDLSYKNEISVARSVLSMIHSRRSRQGRPAFEKENKQVPMIDPRIIFEDTFDKSLQTLRSKKRATIYSSQMRQDAKSWSLHPDEYSLTLTYNYLANSSLNAIEILPYVRSNKNHREYLINWWSVCKKQSILCDELKSIDDELNDIFLSFCSKQEILGSDSQNSAIGAPSSSSSSRKTEEDNDDDAMTVSYAGMLLSRLTYERYGIGSNSKIQSGYKSRAMQSKYPKNDGKLHGPDSQSHNRRLFSIPLTVEETDCLNSIEKILIERLLKICESHIARVVCVGDVHGCITELQDLLRHVGFKPGDLVLLLGDMVAKGPASAQVVQLAREVGAVSVRGNHDYEVIRRVVEELKLEYKKVKSERHAANDNTIGLTNNSEVTGNIPKSQKAVSDHVKIARELSESDIEWLLRLPYYITSPDLGSIFVHAGMLSRTELNKQNPWVMMNMRSATTDGKVSPRCLHHYPWAQHWSGPLTIYFGHDAARGLQIYENAVGLDTGCVYGERLTAILLPSKEIVSVPAHRAYVDSRKSQSHKTLASSRAPETISTASAVFNLDDSKHRSWSRNAPKIGSYSNIVSCNLSQSVTSSGSILASPFSISSSPNNFDLSSKDKLIPSLSDSSVDSKRPDSQILQLTKSILEIEDENEEDDLSDDVQLQFTEAPSNVDDNDDDSRSDLEEKSDVPAEPSKIVESDERFSDDEDCIQEIMME